MGTNNAGCIRTWVAISRHRLDGVFPYSVRFWGIPVMKGFASKCLYPKIKTPNHFRPGFL